MGGRLALGAQSQRRRRYPPSFVVHKRLQSGPISNVLSDNLAAVIPRSLPVRLGIGMPEMALPAPLLQQPALSNILIPLDTMTTPQDGDRTTRRATRSAASSSSSSSSRATPTIISPRRAAMETSMARAVQVAALVEAADLPLSANRLALLTQLSGRLYLSWRRRPHAFNEVTSSGNESLGASDSQDEAFVDQSRRVEIAASEPEANNAPVPQPPPVQHIKQEFHPGDPEDPDDPDGHIPGVFGDIPLPDLPSASPVTLRMILNLVWRLSLAYALFGVYVGALKLTKYWLIRLLGLRPAVDHNYARSQARRRSMRSAPGNGQNTSSPSRRSPWYYKAVLALVAASTALPRSSTGGFLSPSIRPATSSLLAHPACAGMVWHPPPTKTWVLGNYVEADYVVAASHQRSTVRFSIPSPYQSSIHHNNRPIALAEVLGRTLVAFPPIAGHLLHLLQGICDGLRSGPPGCRRTRMRKAVCRFIHAFVHSHFYAPLHVLPLHVETNPDRDHDTVEQICIRLGIDDAFCYLPAGVAEATAPTTSWFSASDSDVSKLSLSPSRGGVMDALKADPLAETLIALGSHSPHQSAPGPTHQAITRSGQPSHCLLASRLTPTLPERVLSSTSGTLLPANAVNVPLAAHHHLARKTRRPMVHPRRKLPAAASPVRARSLDEYHTTQLGELRGAIYGSFAKLKLAYQKKIALCDDSSEGLDLFCQNRLWFSDTLEILRRLYDWKFALILSEQMEEQHRFEYGELLTPGGSPSALFALLANLAASGMADSASEDIANRLRAASMMAKRESRSSLFNRANPPPPNQPPR
ncbi:hypothetical protein BKA70DRAFT_1283609, partial [Coprinopsis sp. MPI-PUGE-AT-0042]